jgi:phosphatidylglycerol:prolipoprotein diacylglycerol transferase
MNARHAWNMLVLAVFAALVASRLLLIVMNLSDLRKHPAWLLAVAMVHHPLLTGVGVLGGLIAVVVYARWMKLSLRVVMDALAAPVSVGMAAEQVGALLAGSDYGTETQVRWAVVYTSPWAARWSAAPMDTPVHPVQAYAALGALFAAVLAFVWLRRGRRPGDAAGVWLIAAGAVLYLTENFRDWEGRGVMLGGFIDAPQLVALGLVLAGGWLLTDRGGTRRMAEPTSAN